MSARTIVVGAVALLAAAVTVPTGRSWSIAPAPQDRLPWGAMVLDSAVDVEGGVAWVTTAGPTDDASGLHALALDGGLEGAGAYQPLVRGATTVALSADGSRAWVVRPVLRRVEGLDTADDTVTDRTTLPSCPQDVAETGGTVLVTAACPGDAHETLWAWRPGAGDPVEVADDVTGRLLTLPSRPGRAWTFEPGGVAAYLVEGLVVTRTASSPVGADDLAGSADGSRLVTSGAHVLDADSLVDLRTLPTWGGSRVAVRRDGLVAFWTDDEIHQAWIDGRRSGFAPLPGPWADSRFPEERQSLPFGFGPRELYLGYDADEGVVSASPQVAWSAQLDAGGWTRLAEPLPVTVTLRPVVPEGTDIGPPPDPSGRVVHLSLTDSQGVEEDLGDLTTDADGVASGQVTLDRDGVLTADYAGDAVSTSARARRPVVVVGSLAMQLRGGRVDPEGVRVYRHGRRLTAVVDVDPPTQPRSTVSLEMRDRGRWVGIDQETAVADLDGRAVVTLSCVTCVGRRMRVRAVHAVSTDAVPDAPYLSTPWTRVAFGSAP